MPFEIIEFHLLPVADEQIVRLAYRCRRDGSFRVRIGDDLDALSGGLTAPMPGAVLSTEIEPGDKVTLLLILEAMTMEYRITAPTDGVIEALHVRVGDQVGNSQLLVTIQ